MDCIPPASSVHGIFQVRILEWIASSPASLSHPGIKPRSALQAGSLPSEPPGKQMLILILNCREANLPRPEGERTRVFVRAPADTRRSRARQSSVWSAPPQEGQEVGLPSRTESRRPSFRLWWGKGLLHLRAPSCHGRGSARAARSRSKHVSPLTCMRKPWARSFGQGGPRGPLLGWPGPGRAAWSPETGKRSLLSQCGDQGGRGWMAHGRRNGNCGDGRWRHAHARERPAGREDSAGEDRVHVQTGRSCRARGRGDAGRSPTQASSRGQKALRLPRRTLGHGD